MTGSGETEICEMVYVEKSYFDFVGLVTIFAILIYFFNIWLNLNFGPVSKNLPSELPSRSRRRGESSKHEK